MCGRRVAPLRDSAWTDAGQGWEGTESSLRLAGWGRARRVVVLRRRLAKDLAVEDRSNPEQLRLSLTELADDVRIYDQTLTATEVQALMTPATAPHAGDFDADGDVDGADFVAWQTHFPTATGATLADGDADADGDVDGADFVVWQTNFPFTPGPGAAPVPEPQTALLLGIASAFALVSRRKLAR